MWYVWGTGGFWWGDMRERDKTYKIIKVVLKWTFKKWDGEA
jgi:hypothetical protein